ncbi:MAG: serine/threonine-protein kinase, partial [Planctomycetota bacterium]
MSSLTPRGQSEDSSPTPGGSILDSIARRAGRAAHVNLKDAGTGGEAPIIDPKAHAFQEELSVVDQGKYRILGEIARGGMGVVLRGHDVELGRDIAIKVTDAELAKRPEVLERFVEEAQIGGQLQHPGIVPVYELGLMEDQRPFFTMKLIKGRTLAAMLTRRKSVEEDRARFLGIWELVCQTMAYAHSKGVIHRDLKPANIMVGAFGEVQVVDWGLSKVLQRGGVADEIEARDTALSVIETVRSGPGSGSGSMVGSILGTPAYMSPEQAQGEPDKLDERTDVFALGAILCEILTGSPPYVAEGNKNLVQMAALGELDDARQRIEDCSAAKDLKRLCLASLMISRAARPRDAEEQATAV